MIKAVNLSKVFRTDEIETAALQQVNLQVQKGEFVAIMGPSGCGKSSLLNIIGLLDIPLPANTISTGWRFPAIRSETERPCEKAT